MYWGFFLVFGNFMSGATANFQSRFTMLLNKFDKPI